MNFDSEITIHNQWRSRIAEFIKAPDGSINVADLGSDRVCDLGRWLYGEGAKWSSSPEYAALRFEHARFHQAAARVVATRQRGERVFEQIALGAGSEFADSLAAIERAIAKVRLRLTNNAEAVGAKR
ncbi:MAG: CZB domain-containing protein [Capsulimonadaceae bacterium]|nr:CZB domain-containing protein [Capsulimonadaceae bacterium]